MQINEQFVFVVELLRGQLADLREDLEFMFIARAFRVQPTEARNHIVNAVADKVTASPIKLKGKKKSGKVVSVPKAYEGKPDPGIGSLHLDKRKPQDDKVLLAVAAPDPVSMSGWVAGQTCEILIPIHVTCVDPDRKKFAIEELNRIESFTISIEKGLDRVLSRVDTEQ